MCGIAGKVTFDGERGDRALIHAMCETIVRRGPDGEGIYTGPNVGLGERRLAVIDLDPRSNPPLANEDKSIWIVFNGEIYNYKKLGRDLRAKGYRFQTQSDTEVILHLYEEHGFDCLELLEGMFAFAIWDSRKNLVFAARDRLGKKPLVYQHSSQALVFGSSIRTVMRGSSSPVMPNFRAIDEYLSRQYVPSPDTAFEGVRKLPAAHFLVCNRRGQLRIQRYWSPPVAKPAQFDYEEAKLELRRRLAESVQSRLTSDVPIGALLSGGIDSGLVVALMAEASGAPVRTFSIGFEEATHNELPYARQVAERFATVHTEYMVKPEVGDLLPMLVREYAEPFGDSSAIPSFYVSKMARNDVTVALTGDGGDESFAGYDHYRLAEKWGRFDGLPDASRKAVLFPVINALEYIPYGNFSARVSRGARLISLDLPNRYLENTAIFKREEKDAGYSTQFKSLIASGEGNSEMHLPEYLEGTAPVDWMMQHDQQHYLPDCLMVKADVASMANSLELRSPFLDHRLIEFAATIPLDFKHDGNTGKQILRDLAKEMLPPDIVSKQKTGFGIPLAKWLRNDLADLMRGALLDDTARKRGLFRQEFVARMVREHLSETRDWSTRLWALMWLELWFREYCD